MTLYSKFIDWGKWSATLFFMIGALSISVFPQTGLQSWPFLLFLLGHLLWFLAGVFVRDKALIALNLMYVPFDLYAIILRLGTA